MGFRTQHGFSLSRERTASYLLLQCIESCTRLGQSMKLIFHHMAESHTVSGNTTPFSHPLRYLTSHSLCVVSLDGCPEQTSAPCMLADFPHRLHQYLLVHWVHHHCVVLQVSASGACMCVRVCVCVCVRVCVNLQLACECRLMQTHPTMLCIQLAYSNTQTLLLN